MAIENNHTRYKGTETIRISMDLYEKLEKISWWDGFDEYEMMEAIMETMGEAYDSGYDDHAGKIEEWKIAEELLGQWEDQRSMNLEYNKDERTYVVSKAMRKKMKLVLLEKLVKREGETDDGEKLWVTYDLNMVF